MHTAQKTSPGFGLPPPTFLPRRYKPRNVGEWTGHLTFASDLIVALQPKLIVELGTHWGEAYFTFCQTVQEHGLGSLCYAVDHWQGDEHAGHYGEEVFDEVSSYNSRYYKQFSYLLRKSFDEALSQFSGNSIGLLHIDGLHTYEAVEHDFRSWLPKVAAGGIILLHDICPRHQDFGVWRVWEEIRAEFPDTFEFHHSWGLGVVRKPGNTSDTLLTEFLFDSSPAVREEVRRHYVIYASHLEHLLGRVPPVPPKVDPISEIRVEVFPYIDGGYSHEASQIRKMKVGSWHTLVFDLRDPNIRGPLRIDPGSEPSIIEVGDILIHSAETGDLIWSSKASRGNREFQVAGTATPHAHNPSVMINMGDDPQLVLTSAADLRGPLKLTLSLKIMSASVPALEIVRDDLQVFSDNLQTAVARANAAEDERSGIQAELTQVRSSKAETETALQNTRQLLTQAEETITGVHNSLSWKLTAPLRKVMAALRSGTGKIT